MQIPGSKRKRKQRELGLWVYRFIGLLVRTMCPVSWLVLSLFIVCMALPLCFTPNTLCSPLDAGIHYLASSIQHPVSSIQHPESRTWIDGTHYLIERRHQLIDMGEQSQLAPGRAQQQPQVGDQRTFYAVDFSRFGNQYTTDTTCRAVGEFCYIFVEDKQWQSGAVTQTGVVKLERAFDESTPTDPFRGIYELETETLGSAPDEIDKDPRIYILVLDILDGSSGFSDFVAGYFDPLNQERGSFRDPSTGMMIYSNEVEMIYVDADPLEVGSVMSYELLAHEFQHLLHWHHDPDEDRWVNEGCADYAALLLCGYDSDNAAHVRSFERTPQTSLVYWPGVEATLANYGATYLWTVYLHEHYGGFATISSLIAHPNNGINGINAVLSAQGYSQDFEDVFSDWKIANFLDDSNFASGKYGYSSLDVQTRTSPRHSSYPVTNSSRYLKSWASDYIKFTGGDGISSLQIDFTGRNPAHTFDVRAIPMLNGAPVSVKSVQIQADAANWSISIPEFGYAVDTVILAPSWKTTARAEFGDTAYYSYSARLGEEINLDVAILPNPVHEQYVDILAQFDRELGGAGNSEGKSAAPDITITRLGETLVREESMVLITSPDSEAGVKPVYAYQLYIPRDWDGSEISWEISYLSRSLSWGDLENVQSDH